MKRVIYPMSYIEQRITDELKAFSAPVCIFAKRQFEPEDLVHSATIAFVDTGEGKFLVTCQHVWEKFSELCASNPETVLAASIGPNQSLVTLDGLEYVDGDRK